MWEVTTVADVAHVLAGYAFSSKRYQSAGSGVRLLRGINVSPNFLDWTDEASWQRGAGDGLDQYELAEGDIVVGMDRPWISSGFRCAVVQGRDLPALLVQRVARIRSRAKAEQRYLAHLFRTPAFERHLKARHTETTVPHVSHRDIETFEFALPPLAEQRRIADILDNADAIRRKRKEAIALTEALLRSTFLDMFGDPETNPKGWPTVPIEALASAARNALAIGPFGSNLLSSDYTTSGHPVIFVRDLVKGHFVWKSNVFVSAAKFAELAAHHAQPGDVLATKMGEPPGIACVVPDEFSRAVVTADVVKVSVDRAKVFPAYLAAAINSPFGRLQISGITAGVTRAKITLRDFRNVLVRLPPLEQQRRYVDHVAKVARTKEELALGSAEANRLFGSLVARAFSGSLEVAC